VDRARVAEILRRPHVSSIQVTFDPDRPPERHAMPPGGFRLAIVNCWNLEAGRAARADLKRLFRGLVIDTREARPRRTARVN
jgi:hypothetical protein